MREPDPPSQPMTADPAPERTVERLPRGKGGSRNPQHERQCARSGCTNLVPAEGVSHNRLYCSLRCTNAAQQQRLRNRRRGYLYCEGCGHPNRL